MNEPRGASEHPARQLPLEERVDYLRVVAAMAAADGNLVAAEVDLLRKSCNELGLGPAEMGHVIVAAERPDAAGVREICRRLRSSDLRFTLMTDLLFMAYADDAVVEAEKRELSALADALGVTEKQLLAIKEYVAAVRKAAKAEAVTGEDIKRLGGDVAASLASVGVPVAAVAAAGIPGLSAVGITSGLAALGLGLGMASGIGVAVAIGVGTYFSVRWLYKRVVGT